VEERAAAERRAIRIRGVVQGVGFRPAMYRLADSLGLAGFVQNDADGVWLEIEGPSASLEQFVDGISRAAPPASRIDQVDARAARPLGEVGFRIAASGPGTTLTGATEIPADLAPCEDCLRELADPEDRRAGYPFINCTACGPRFTIVRGVPYDRLRTTMATFAMCSACAREYADPADRRFHAEPNACPVCGPQARLFVAGWGELSGAAAITAAAQAISDGLIVAVKGAGGYVLAVDATNDYAVARLRVRKRRFCKPFAVMGRSLADLALIGDLTGVHEVLRGPSRPIVLVPAREDSALAAGVAPRLADVGVFLPPTPLQHQLLAAGPALQVMTSGNLADEPIARTDDQALAQLARVADVFLMHDREIHARADDSVLRASRRGAIPMRRARGFVPGAIELVVAGPPLLAVGGHERSTICVGQGGRATLSPHIGELDHPEAYACFREAIARMRDLVGVSPVAIAHDLHPDYRSTRWALAAGLPTVGVQHHHAHVAACLAEHGRSDRVLGVAFDGTGLGDDGTLWGGEILEADLGTAVRLGHLQPIALAGGEAAIREPWRLAVAALVDAGESLAHVPHRDATMTRRIRGLLDSPLAAPRATSAGRWFDAIAALLGIGHVVSYDGQPAAELEALAASVPRGELDPFDVELVVPSTGPFVLELRRAVRQLVRARVRGTPRSRLAARFHDTLAVAVRDACRHARAGGAPSTVVLTGGCFQNRRLLERSAALLEADGFELLVHRRVPPNDGGLALGQLAVASYRLARSAHVSRDPG
jgi:hydrogenase maturation protein HypF